MARAHIFLSLVLAVAWLGSGVGPVARPQAGYLEPDRDMVSVEWAAPVMEVYYGTFSSAGGIYASGHTFQIIVRDPDLNIKAMGTVTSTTGGASWWGNEGFRPSWAGGDCCAWSPAEPDFRPRDVVQFYSDDGYQNYIWVGAIYGTIDVEADSVTGRIYAPLITQTLEVWCWVDWLHARQSTAAPDGSVPYLCDWQDPGGGEPWDIKPDDQVMVVYWEPDGDMVYRQMLASEGAPLLSRVYLPLVAK